jgi:hypothetical protein
MPGWGSWQWVGSDLLIELARHYRSIPFHGLQVPRCDALVIVKHALPAGLVQQTASKAAVFYCPIDYYGSAEHIVADQDMLCCCTRVLVHSEVCYLR